MALIDELIKGNERFLAESWDPGDAELTAAPRRKLAVVACMDTRYTVERVLGLEHGDAKIIRNAGNVIDDAAMRSLIVAVHALGVERIVVMGHTQCGMAALGTLSDPVRESLRARTDVDTAVLDDATLKRELKGFDDPDGHVQAGLAAIRAHPWMPAELELIGLVYENDTGRVRHVATA